MVTVNNIARGLQKEFFWLVVGFAAMIIVEAPICMIRDSRV